MNHFFELEIWAQNLLKHFKGHIVHETLVDESSLTNLSQVELDARLRGKKLKDVNREARFIVLTFGDDSFVVLDAYNSGNFNISNLMNSGTRLLVNFKQNKSLKFNKSEGKANLEFVKGNLSLSKLLENKGLDVKHLDYDRFGEILNSENSELKLLLSGQNRISGLSSADSDEILFHAGINPLKFSNELSETEVYKLYNALFSYIKSNLESSKNEIGDYFSKAKSIKFYVHDNDAYCRICGTKIQNTQLLGSKLFFCPQCQN